MRQTLHRSNEEGGVRHTPARGQCECVCVRVDVCVCGCVRVWMCVCVCVGGWVGGWVWMCVCGCEEIPRLDVSDKQSSRRAY